MKRAYIFVYNDEVGTQEEVKNVLDKMPLIYTWRYDMPNMFYLVSSASADEISDQFQDFHGTEGRFIFLEYTDNSQGLLLGDSWYLLDNKIHKRNESSD